MQSPGSRARPSPSPAREARADPGKPAARGGTSGESSRAGSDPHPSRAGAGAGSRGAGTRWRTKPESPRGREAHGPGRRGDKRGRADSGVPGRGRRRTHPEKAHFELPYRHHVLRAGPGRGSASSGARAAPAPSQRSPVSAFPSRRPRAEPPLLFLGRRPRRGRSRGCLPAPPGTSGLTSSAPRNAPRRQPPRGGPGGVPPASDQLSSWTRLYRAASGNCPSSPAG